MGLPDSARIALLVLSVIGMLSSVFLEDSSVVSFVHPHGSGGTGSCPVLQAGFSSPKRPPVDLTAVLQLEKDDSRRLDMNDVAHLPPERMEVLSQEELAFYDGISDLRRVLVAVKGYVFDVTDSKEIFRSLGGTSITKDLVFSSLEVNEDDMEEFTKESEKWLRFFLRTFPLLARLDEEDVTQEDHLPGCPSVSFSEAGLKTNMVVTKNGAVLDVGDALWLYGGHGIRFGLDPKDPTLYPCLGFSA